MMEKSLQNGLFDNVVRTNPTTLQINLGYKCNQSCSHCHVDAGPNREEMMSMDILKMIPDVIDKYNIEILDLTGGAPELHPKFRYLVEQTKGFEIDILDRCNLTILNEPGQEDLAQFLAKHEIIIIASLPCYEAENVNTQRGHGVFESSIKALKSLNKLGYGLKDTNLLLHLVYNPQGPNLPPPQKALENEYKYQLKKQYDIHFNTLYTLANMPIKRFADRLKRENKFDSYHQLLVDSFNPLNLDNLMCRNTISVDWQGFLFDCDFNQQLGLGMPGQIKHINDLLSSYKQFKGEKISFNKHCLGCTAGSGSSCCGSLS